jgi:hypothetical protein
MMPTADEDTRRFAGEEKEEQTRFTRVDLDAAGEERKIRREESDEQTIATCPVQKRSERKKDKKADVINVGVNQDRFPFLGRSDMIDCRSLNVKLVGIGDEEAYERRR